MHKIFSKKVTEESWGLITLVIGFILLRLPSLYEPYWYGDEGIYFTVGRAIRAGRQLYTQIWDNKPPLLYWFYTIFNDLYSIRLVSLLFGLFALLAFFALSTHFFKSVKLRLLTTGFFALFFALPTFEGTIANAENFMLFPIILAAFLFLENLDQKTKQKQRILFFTGLLIGLAFLFKTVAVFDLSTFAVFAFFLALPERKFNFLHALTSFLHAYRQLFYGFLLPLLLICLLFLVQGILPEFLTTIFLRNTDYVGVNNAFIIPQGLLVLKLFVLVLGLLVIFYKRRSFSPNTLFVSLWFLFSLFNAFFSQRPYIHYQLVLLPVFSLAIGVLFTHKRKTEIAKTALSLIITITLLFGMFQHWPVKKSIAYYENFVSFLTKHESVETYQAFFDRNTPDDYAIAEYLRLHTKPGQTIFLWGDHAQIYYLSDTLPIGRYTVSYHIVTSQTLQETQTVLQHHPPRFIAILPDALMFPFTLPDYGYKLTVGNTRIYERLN